THGGADEVLDPVCGMTVDPAKYLAKQKAPEPELPAGTTYTCPMHPEIRQVGPGSCPICGMALEPELASLD
uniref:heavy metal-binding domain-containing protein n=1 Tax=Serratia marcescens TaxID=615 RepID=UPI0013DAE1D5